MSHSNNLKSSCKLKPGEVTKDKLVNALSLKRKRSYFKNSFSLCFRVSQITEWHLLNCLLDCLTISLCYGGNGPYENRQYIVNEYDKIANCIKHSGILSTKVCHFFEIDILDVWLYMISLCVFHIYKGKIMNCSIYYYIVYVYSCRLGHK